jgi:hypothetical protein
LLERRFIGNFALLAVDFDIQPLFFLVLIVKSLFRRLTGKYAPNVYWMLRCEAALKRVG